MSRHRVLDVYPAIQMARIAQEYFDLLNSPFMMKKITRGYWIVTGLMVAFMLLGAGLDVSQAPDAVALIGHLGYPAYFVPFIGVMKIAGVITVLLPGLPKLKQWAYAGLTFDTAGALFSHVATGDAPSQWFPALLGLGLVLGSYALYTRRSKFASTSQIVRMGRHIRLVTA